MLYLFYQSTNKGKKLVMSKITINYDKVSIIIYNIKTNTKWILMNTNLLYYKFVRWIHMKEMDMWLIK